MNQIFDTQIDTIYLFNYYDNDELPHPDVYSSLGTGINVSSVRLTREVVEICHAKGKQVGVWIDRDLFCENEEFYFTLYSMGVDFFCSDFPHQAIEAINKFEMKSLLKSDEHKLKLLMPSLAMAPIDMRQQSEQRQRFLSLKQEYVSYF